ASGNQLVQIAKTGQTIPQGTITGVGNYSPSINASGQVAFSGSIDSGSSSLLRFDGQNYTELVQYGQQSPRGDGTLLLVQDFSFNNLGQAAFVTFDVADPNLQDNYRDAVFRADGTSLVEIAREGDPAPGGVGKIFPSVTYYQTPPLNNRGQVAYEAYVTGTAG